MGLRKSAFVCYIASYGKGIPFPLSMVLHVASVVQKFIKLDPEGIGTHTETHEYDQVYTQITNSGIKKHTVR